MTDADTLVVHDAGRCPDCDSFGTIVDLMASSTVSDQTRRVRRRTYECWECDRRWRRYG